MAAAPTWVAGADGSDGFGVDHLPYGSVIGPRGLPRAVTRIGRWLLDLTVATTATEYEALFTSGSLDALLAAGPDTWAAVRARLQDWLTDPELQADLEPLLSPAAQARHRLPFTVADYVDFYASERHATHVGQILRPGTEPLPPSWRHLPIGYHGRAGTVVVSGTDIRRPRGQFPVGTSEVHFGPTQRLDFEAELGFVVGAGSDPGRPLAPSALADHVFGVVLVNDWSARDIQAWEYVPLGPMLGKSFGTSISALVTPLAALPQAWVAPPPRDPPPLPHLDDSTAPGALAVDLEIAINGHTVSRPSARALYWTAGQMVAHLTSNGTGLRPGDLFASGTISGPDPDQDGCLLELTENGARPLTLGDGSSREYLLDGDEVTITARAEGALSPLQLGEVRGNILPAGETGAPRPRE